MRIRRLVAAAAASLAAATSLVACSSASSDFAAGTAEDPIIIGTTDAELPEWGVLKELAAQEGIAIELKSFTDYATPNQSLAEGSTDTNKFQHLKFLAEYNAGNGTNLVPVASTQVYPMPLFWKGHDSIDGIEGQDIAIPNDATNQGRAINLLAANGLLKLKEEGKPAIITNSFFKRAGIDPVDAVLYDDPENPNADPKILFDPYVNVWAVQEKDKDNEKVKKLAELYLSDEVKAAVQDTTGGTTIFVDKPQAELQEILDRLEEEASSS